MHSRAFWGGRASLQDARDALECMVSDHPLSEHRVCRLVGIIWDNYRPPSQADQATVALHERIVEIAHVRSSAGCRRIHDVLSLQFSYIKHQWVFRSMPGTSQAGCAHAQTG
jgi:hypothetical protein